MLTRYCTLAGFLLCLVTTADGSDVRALKFTGIDFPGARITEASGINNLGQIVGTWEDPDSRLSRGFLLSSGVYTSMEFPDALLTTASGINDAGDIVGTYFVADGSGNITETHGFVMSAGGDFTTITFPGKVVTTAFGINNAGHVVGAYVDVDGDQGTHGFLFESGSFTQIDFPVANGVPPVTFAVGINDDGHIVGGYNDADELQTRRGYVLRDGVFSTFNVPQSLMTDLFGINNFGELVGIYQDPKDSQFYSFLFSPKRGVSRLAATGNPKRRLTLVAALDLSDGGQIVGSTVFDGSLHGFLASPPKKR